MNQTTKEGGTPLGIACELGHMAVVELLLSAKAGPLLCHPFLACSGW